jgi:AraC-like DNA-binding protein
MLSTPDHFGPRLFRTGAIPENQRFRAWNEVVNGWLLGVESKPASDAPFRGSACLRALPDLRFGHGLLDGTLNRRTSAIVSQDNDDFFLFVNSGGAFAASQRGQETEIAVGGAYLMSCAEPGEYRWPEGMKLTVIRVRQEPIAALARNACDNLGRAILPDNEGLRLLIGYLRGLHDAAPFSSAEVCALVTHHVEDILALALGAMGDGRELARARGLRAARLKAVQTHIERNLGRPDLSPEFIARRFGISLRTLQRLFEEEGTSFTEYVMEKRLSRAYTALSNWRSGGAGGIADVALASGFGNISYFNRAFRARYGATPSDIRASNIQPIPSNSAVDR